jgi:hypothetical protein
VEAELPSEVEGLVENVIQAEVELATAIPVEVAILVGIALPVG